MRFIFLRHLFSFAFSVGLTVYFVHLFSRIARKYKILDIPDGKIKKQEAEVPYLGGLAIFLSFIMTLALVYPFKNSILWLVLGTTLLLFVGFIDDLSVFKPLQKLTGQLVAILCFLRGGLALKATFFSDYLNIVVSGFWMLSVINAFNLVDVMDGLSSLLAIIIAFSFFVIALLTKQYYLSLLLLSFLSPLLVFFLYNKPPARIYLGDSGAMFMGGFLAAVPLLFSWSYQNPLGYFVPIIILGIPLFEIVMLVIIRTVKRIPFYNGSPHHFSSYLQAKRWEKAQILLFVGVISLLLSFIAILFLFNSLSFRGLLLYLVILLIIWLNRVFGESFLYFWRG